MSFIPHEVAIGILREDLGYNVVALPGHGASGSKVIILRDLANGQLYAVKVSSKKPRIDFEQVAQRQRVLEEYLRNKMPAIGEITYSHGMYISVSECKGTDTLFNLIQTNSMSHAELSKIWGEILTKMHGVWIASTSPYVPGNDPKNHVARSTRIEEGLKTLFHTHDWDWRLASFDLTINGKNAPSIQDMLRESRKHAPPSSGVVCHGDVQTTNIVVDGTDWSFVDFEWSGAGHDWRTSIARAYSFWPIMHSVIANKPSIVATPSGLIIDTGDAAIPEHISRYYMQPVRDMFRVVSNGILGADSDNPQSNRNLISLYLGDTRFVSAWRRTPVIPFLFEAASQAYNQIYSTDTNDVRPAALYHDPSATSLITCAS